MGTEYQEDQKERYEKMMEEIAGHPDFGIRNPVDIGIDCGYTEEKVMEMIQFLQDFKEQPETGDRNGDDREKYYFLLKNDSQEHYIASVNINTWETEWVKDVKTMPYCFRIKGAIYAYAVKTAQENILEWENLETGDKGKFQTGENIHDILIVDNGIAVITKSFFALFQYQGEKIQIKHRFIGQSMLMEGKDAIYVISVHAGGNSRSEIWKVEKESFLESVIWDSDMEIVVVECVDGNLVWYVNEQHGFSKCSEKYLPEYKSKKLSLSYQWRDFGCTEGISTKNYELLLRTIFGMQNGGIICDFDRIMRYGKKITNGQTIGIYEKDIFVGVGMSGQNIIKVDLRIEKNPVILSVHKK